MIQLDVAYMVLYGSHRVSWVQTVWEIRVTQCSCLLDSKEEGIPSYMELSLV